MMNNLKDTLTGALKLGGKTLLDYFDRPLKTAQKESQSSIVTEADLKSDSLITAYIAKKFPDHNIISEEGGFRNNNSDYTWIIDPLDGTSNFASGIPWFGVLVSLFENDVPLMGGAYLPVTDTLYFAERGGGAFRNARPMKKIMDSVVKDSLIAFSVDYTEDEEFLNRGLSLYKDIVRNARNIRSTNSLIDFLYVAEGKFGGCINLYTKIWDIAGLGLIISEAGGIMKKVTGNEIRYKIGKHIIAENFPVICGTREVVDFFMSADRL
jgi:myo-inositol-1(or 4)-monophosphatase